MNAIGQRSNVAQSGTAFAGSRDIAWGYDSLGQVTSADSTIPGLDRAYQFDLIGNRLKSADSLWTRLILDLNRASEAIGRSIEQIRQIANGLKALFDPSCT